MIDLSRLLKVLPIRLTTLCGVALSALFLVACTSFLMPRVMEPVIKNIERQDDVDLVCDGAPAFLLMLDSIIENDPSDTRLLINGAQAYTAYSHLMPECGKQERVAALSVKARKYALGLLEGLGLQYEGAVSPMDLAAHLKNIDRFQVEQLFWAASGLATWIKAQQGSPASIVELPRLVQLMERILELDASYYNGGVHLFFGIYYGSRPEMLGGNLALSQEHFEKALAVGKRRLLSVQVAYAEVYAKMRFDKVLYEKLLHEVIAYSLDDAPDLRLSNALAKRQAERLLAEAADYF